MDAEKEKFLKQNGWYFDSESSEKRWRFDLYENGKNAHFAVLEKLLDKLPLEELKKYHESTVRSLRKEYID